MNALVKHLGRGSAGTRSLPRRPVDPPDLLGTPEGTLSLERVRPELVDVETDFCCEYASGISTADWEHAVDQMTRGSDDRANWLAAQIRYTLSGRCDRGYLVAVSGSSADWLVYQVGRALGDYSTPFPPWWARARLGGGEPTPYHQRKLLGRRIWPVWGEWTIHEQPNLRLLERYARGSVLTVSSRQDRRPADLDPQFVPWLAWQTRLPLWANQLHLPGKSHVRDVDPASITRWALDRGQLEASNPDLRALAAQEVTAMRLHTRWALDVLAATLGVSEQDLDSLLAGDPVDDRITLRILRGAQT